jgi:vitamin B12 transporter
MAHLAGVAVLASPPALASAQTTPTSVPTFSVSVTEATELVEAVGTTRRIGRAEIEARSARTLDEALRLMPGIYVRTGGDGTPRIDVRGFRARHVLLLVNGVPANSTADGQFDPARLSTDAIREIKVSYGSSSVLYGDNALAAVIEITTIDSTPETRMSVSAGTPDQQGAGGRFARTIGNWSLTATATRFDTAGFRLADSFAPTALEDGGRRQNGDRDRGDLRGAVGYRSSPRLSLSSEWSFGAGSYGVPGSVVDDPADIFAQAPRFERVEGYRLGSGQVSVAAAPSPRVSLRAWAFRNRQTEDRSRYDDDSYSSMDDPLAQGTFESRERTVVTGASALARLDLQRLGWLRLAANQRRESFDSSGVIRDVPSAGGSGGGGGGGGRGGGSGSQPATFAVRPFSIDQHVDVSSLGAEWQAHPATRLGTVVGAAVNVQHRPGVDAKAEPAWIAGVSYDATDAMRLHASATRKVRVPSIDQLFNTSSGNPDLRAEHAYGVDAGASYRLGTASSVAVSVFSTSGVLDLGARLHRARIGSAVREPRSLSLSWRGSDRRDEPRGPAGSPCRLQLPRCRRPHRRDTAAADAAAAPRLRGVGVDAACRLRGARRRAAHRLAALRLPRRGSRTTEGRRLYRRRRRVHADAGAALRHRLRRRESLRRAVRSVVRLAARGAGGDAVAARAGELRRL